MDRCTRAQTRAVREAEFAERQRKSPQLVCASEYEGRRQRFEAVLAQLPAEQAEVVTLNFWSDLTFAQIAKVTSTPPGKPFWFAEVNHEVVHDLADSKP